MRTILLTLLLTLPAAAAEPHPVAFLAFPRTTGFFPTASVSEQGSAKHIGTDLIVLLPDGTEKLLVKGEQPDKGLLYVDSFCWTDDAQSIVYAQAHTVPGASPIFVVTDLYRINVASGEIVQLTNAVHEAEPPRGAGKWLTIFPATHNAAYAEMDKGFTYAACNNTEPAVYPDGTIVFCSDRRQIKSPGESVQRAAQMYVMNADGSNVRCITPMSLGGVASPMIGKDGKIYFSSGEQQGLRAQQGNGWAIWKINRDGSGWEPVISALGMSEDPWHFQCVTSDGSTVAAKYYDTRIYGALFRVPPFLASPFGPRTMFGSPLALANPPVANGYSRANADGLGSYPITMRMGFQPRGIHSIAPWAGHDDYEMRAPDGQPVGMLSHPAAIPGNGIYFTHTDTQGDGAMNLRVCKLADVTQPIASPADLVIVADKPDRHELLARPGVGFKSIYSHDCPLPAGDRSPNLPPGSPFCEVGTSTVLINEVLDRVFITQEEQQLITFDHEDAEWIRFQHFNPTTHYRGYFYAHAEFQAVKNSNPGNPTGITNYEGFSSAINERTGYYDLVPLKKWRKTDGTVHYGPNPPDGATRIMGPDGKPDTSFRCFLPADQPWTFQLLNRKGEVIFSAKTWHQGIPGERRVDCNGCHAHNEPASFAFSQTFAATAEYFAKRLDKVHLTVFERDIQPIVEKYGLTLGPRAWDEPPFIPAYGSAKVAVDDDDRITDEQDRRKLRTWIDTGMQSAGRFGKGAYDGVQILPEHQVGPYAVTGLPTLALHFHTGGMIVGAWSQAGINWETLSIKCSVPLAGREAGAELADLCRELDEYRRELPCEPAGVSTVSIRDKQQARDGGMNLAGEAGNVSQLVWTVGELSEPPPEPTIEQLLAEIARLKAESAGKDTRIGLLEAEVAAIKSRLARIHEESKP